MMHINCLNEAIFFFGYITSITTRLGLLRVLMHNEIKDSHHCMIAGLPVKVCMQLHSTSIDCTCMHYSMITYITGLMIILSPAF